MDDAPGPAAELKEEARRPMRRASKARQSRIIPISLLPVQSGGDRGETSTQRASQNSAAHNSTASTRSPPMGGADDSYETHGSSGTARSHSEYDVAEQGSPTSIASSYTSAQVASSTAALNSAPASVSAVGTLNASPKSAGLVSVSSLSLNSDSAAPQSVPQSTTERIVDIRGANRRSWFPPLNQLDGGSSLFVRRIQKSKERRTETAQEESRVGLRELQQTFVAKQHSFDSANWEFWAAVVGDYDSVARNQPDRLRRAIQEGFPSELRGLLWQVIASSKSSALEQLYTSLSAEADAPCMSAIEKDLNRTPMAKQVDGGALARVLKAYSLFDPEVGYTQGMAFVAVPLLFELSEVETFSLFVQLMKTYDFRTIFSADMPGLHLRLYQFERLLEDTLESVYTHLRRQGVQSSMYASQWFLTMFAYRFPRDLVIRIFDIVIAEGLEAILHFAVALMQAAADTILSLQGIDQLLPFLKEQIFDKFMGNENELVRLAGQVELYPQVLSKYEIEHQELNRLEKERMEQLDTLRTSNARLTLQNKQLDSSLEALNTEHVQIANKMVESGLELAQLRHENAELKERVAAIDVEHRTYGELVAKLGELTSEVAQLKSERSEMQQELDLLRKSQDLLSTAGLLQRVNDLTEVNKRYESQLGSLQESLASALDNH